MPSTNSIYLGTMSGTSMDGLDIVAVKFTHNQPQSLHQQTIEYPTKLKTLLQSLALRSDATIDEMCKLDTQLGQFYAETINTFIEKNKINRQQIAAIGSHGQTIRHHIDKNTPYTLQIGDPNIIAAQTDLTVVADFRRRDIANGGQGAPLAPAFHHHVFHSDKTDRVIINIGGIANITHLPANHSSPIRGFDTGPGNTLLDTVSQQLLKKSYDKNGDCARRGKIQTNLLQSILKKESYFHQKPPKSTGTDYFSPDWLSNFNLHTLTAPDALATLVELTAISISREIQSLGGSTENCFICGGGAHNGYLLERLSHHLQPRKVATTSQLGVHPDWVEALAFAWLARQTLSLQPGNFPSVTNANKATILGAVHFSHRQL